jgi:hypothetical protein
MSADQEIQVGQGKQYHRPGGAIAGVDRFVDPSGTPVAVLWVSAPNGDGEDLQLRTGDTFEVGDERWQVTDVPTTAETLATIVRQS